MHTGDCNHRPDELVAWREGTLDPGRSAELTVHIQQCPECQQQLEAAAEIDDIFQQNWPLVTDPDGERRTIAAVYGASTPRRNGWIFSTALVTGLLIPLLAIAFLWPPPSGADSGFPGLINAVRSQVGQTGTSHAPVSDTSSTPVDTEGHVVPETLPFDLELTGQEPRQDGGVRLQYTDQDGNLELLVNQGASELWEDTLTTSEPRFARVDGIGVAWTHGQREGTVSALLWERHETVFSILVVAAPPGAQGGLTLENGLTLVETFIDEQDQIPER